MFSKGGAGNDSLDGGSGQDVLWGEAGKDSFVFSTSSEAHGDQVMDFTKGDRLDVSKIDAVALWAGNQKFTFIGTEAFSKPGQLRFEADSSKGITTVGGDLDGDFRADFHINVRGLHKFTSQDFLV